MPIRQAEVTVAKLKGVGAKLLVKPGAEPRWPGSEKDLALFADWFDQQLKKSGGPKR